jgi:hypothetical protein
MKALCCITKHTFILTFSFHIVVCYAVTQRSLCLMFHKSHDVTSLVLYIPAARMFNAPYDILEGKQDLKLRVIEF